MQDLPGASPGAQRSAPAVPGHAVASPADIRASAGRAPAGATDARGGRPDARDARIGVAGAARPAAPVFIGVAWPYANGGLHLGHVAGSLLPPDIFRRYMRMAGHDVLMVSGSDCHGTPIMLKADAEGKTPAEVVEHFHKDHVEALRRLGIGFDLFTRTTTENHQQLVQEIFTACKEMGYIEQRTQPAPFDAKAGRFLPDRYVEGTCPHCKTAGARGDQCDHCGKTLDPQELIEPRSKLNPEHAVEFRDTQHAFFLLSKLQPKLERYFQEHKAHWRPNTVNFTQNWLREGLQDRAITRDLTWGVPIPAEAGQEADVADKRIYVWFEAVCGYFTAAVEWGARGAKGGPGFADLPTGAANAGHADVEGGRGTAVAARLLFSGASLPETADGWRHWWSNDTCRSYYFLGKDNIPFHTIIWPAILIAYNEWRAKKGKPQLVLPYDVPANEFLNLSGQQFSKSRGISIGVHDVLDRFQADAVRYYLSVNMPEQRDADWTWDDFLSKVNDELVGTIGNLIHRVMSFTHKSLGAIPVLHQETDLERDVLAEIETCGRDMAKHLEAVELKKAVRRFLEFAGWGNQVMQDTAPWKLLKEDPPLGESALHSLLRVCKALAVFMAPYMPEAAQKTWQRLGEEASVHDASWADASAPLKVGHRLAGIEGLFVKLDPKDIPGRAAEPAAGTARVAKPGVGPAEGNRAGRAGSPATDGVVGGPGAAGNAAKGAADGPAHGKAADGGVAQGNTAAGKASQDQAMAGASPAQADGVVTFDEFQRLQLRIATIRSVEAHPDADKLYVLKLDVGELGERQVVAGLKAYYEPSELEGQMVAFVANLAPVKLRGVESQGMILAADHEGTVAVLSPHRPVPAGAKIR